MSRIQFLYIDYSRLKDESYKLQNNLDSHLIYPFLLINSKIVYSNSFIGISNPNGVFIESFEECYNRLKSDTKFLSYINLSNPNQILLDLESQGVFSTKIIQSMFEGARGLEISSEQETDAYLLDHYFKKSNRIKLKQIIENSEALHCLDPNKCIITLVETGLKMDIVYIQYKNKTIPWAYLTVQYSNGYYHPVLHIIDFNQFSAFQKLQYNKYFVPDYILQQILRIDKPVVLQANEEDFLPSDQICKKCKFSVASSIHQELCRLWYEPILEFGM